MDTGMVFQMSTRLLKVSATARCTPSVATPAGVFIPVAIGVCGDVVRHVGVVGVMVCVTVEGGMMHGAGKLLTKSGWPSTRLAVPTHTGHRVLYASASFGTGSCFDMLLKISTRLFTGAAPTRLESATNSVSLAKAKPPTAPTMVWLAVSDSASNSGWPITSRAD